MRETRRYSVYPSNLQPVVPFRELQNYMSRCGYRENPKACDNVAYQVDTGNSSSLRTCSYSEFVEILEQSPCTEGVDAHSHWETGGSGDLGCIIYLRRSSLEVTIESSDRNVLGGTHDVVRRLFEASNPPKERNGLLQRFHLKKSMFLAHRFDGNGAAVADPLKTFVMRLGFDVVEGVGYEAREIPQKVAERIAKQDIFLCVATAGDHSWILSEAAFARGLNKYIILMCEQGVSFSTGILGNDYEYIQFPNGFIEKAYSDLLYALPG